MQNSLARRLALTILAVLLACLPALSIAAQKHALLVGVSNYPSLTEHLQLKGPPNDVVLMRTILKPYGFADNNVRVLADGVEGARAPTRAAILADLKNLASTVGEGDFVYLHFSGHGSQQPTKPGKQPPEPDGLDEIFLPADIGKWDGKKGEVKNAIVDTEFGNAITSIRQRGAFVWAVFDSCHSGSMTRGAPVDGVRYRQVRPEDLGVSDKEMASAQASSVHTRGAAQAKGGALGEEAKLKGAGGFVAFYAAQSTETTPEGPQPVSQLDGTRYGIFTYTLAEILARNPNVTYRQIGQQVLNRYAARVMFSPTPLFEGSGLDAPVFGTKLGAFKPQWKVQKAGQELKIAAGALDQLGEGAIFAIVPSPVADDKDILGYAKAVNTRVLETGLEPVEYNRMPALALDKITGGAYVRLVNPKLAMELIVALPPAGNTQNQGKAERVLNKLAKDKTDGIKIKWVKAGQGADLRLTVQDNKIWLLPSSGAIVKSGSYKTHSIDLAASEEKLAVALQTSFQKIAKVVNLLRLTGEMSAGSVATAVETTILHQKAGSTNRTEIKPGTVPSFKTDDRLFFQIKNNHKRAVDVTILFVNSEYGIELMYPINSGDANRIDAESKQVELFDITVNTRTVGVESLIVIAVEAEPQTAMADFSFLTQGSLERTRDAREAGTDDQEELFGLFQEAGYGERTRGDKKAPAAAIKKTMMRVFSWQTTK
jgi:hypothetical protein